MAVYAVRNTRTQSVKIGHSGTPEKRIGGLQTANEDVLVLCGYIESWGRKDEQRIHRTLKKHGEHVRGEWFAGPQTEVQVVILTVIGAGVTAGIPVEHMVSTLKNLAAPTAQGHLMRQSVLDFVREKFPDESPGSGLFSSAL